jgi:signal transduction histidine kinase
MLSLIDLLRLPALGVLSYRLALELRAGGHRDDRLHPWLVGFLLATLALGGARVWADHAGSDEQRVAALWLAAAAVSLALAMILGGSPGLRARWLDPRAQRRTWWLAAVLAGAAGYDVLGWVGIVAGVPIVDLVMAAAVVAVAPWPPLGDQKSTAGAPDELDGVMRARFLQSVFAAQEQERKRIARDLHDATGQSLTSLLVRLRALEHDPEIKPVHRKVAEIRDVAKAALEEVRGIAQGLHPVVLDDLGFEEAVRNYAARFSDAHDVLTDIHMNGLRTHGRLPPPIEIALYRIVQEALTNTAKHAQANTVSILVDRQRDHVRVIIEDDGRGFDPGASVGLGLHSIRERAALCGGQLAIEASPGAGTALYLTIPLPVTGSS